MASFQDRTGKTWTIELDAFSIEAVRTATGIDLADASGAAYVQIETDEVALLNVLYVLLIDDGGETKKQFAKGLRGEATSQAASAVLEAALDFFHAKKRSALESNLPTLRERMAAASQSKMALEALHELQPILEAMKAMPPAMQAGAMEAFRESIAANGGDSSDLQAFEALVSASSSTDSPQSNPAIDSQVKSESTHAA